MTERARTLRSFAVSALVPLLEKLSLQLEDLRTDEDIECLHKARVSTRRLRAALSLFAPCFPPGEAKRWRKAVTRITGLLGEARDLDVQMESVEEELRASGERERPGLARLLLRLSRRREKLQRRICDALDGRDIREPLDGMLDGLREAVRKDILEQEESPSFALCSDEIRARVADVLSFDGFVRNPASVKELHDLRKAGKRLRYALELFEPLSAGLLRPFIERLKALQDLLGEIHDCDVWLDFLPRFLEEEAERTLKYYGHVRVFPPLKTGILAFLEKKRTLRGEDFDRFLVEWGRLGEEAFWDNLNTAAETFRAHRGEEGANHS
jgi:CHAD domain-containing protein